MSWIPTILIFCSILFLYLHIVFHLKKSNDLDVYEIHLSSKEQLEQICNFKQPISFYFIPDKLPSVITRQALIQSYSTFDVNIRKNSNIQEIVLTDSILASKEVKSVKNIRHITIAPLFGEAIKRINSDSSVSALFE